jgi:probable F420-dependent oxidoreductase
MTVAFGWSLTGRGVLADREAITTVARRAEALGYDSIFVTDRLLIPDRPTTAYPYSATGAFPLGPDEPWLECLTAVTYLAAVTTRIQVGTSVLVVPYRSPVHLARALATADYLSGGRIIFGAGIGWWREEFEAVGASYPDRAPRTDEALRLIKEIWTRPRVSFAGRFWTVPTAGGVRPHPVRRPHIPIWIGGHTDGALRRVVRLADGWHPLGLRPPVRLEPTELAARVRRLRELATEAGRDPGTITIAFKAPVAFRDAGAAPRTPLTGSPAEILEDLRAYVRAGVDHFVLDFTVPTVPETLAVLERFVEVRERLVM